MEMNVLPQKCLEFRQSLLALAEPTRKEKGCLSHRVFQNIESDCSLSVIQTWRSRKDLEDHLRSDTFTFLMGTRYLLSRQMEISISEGSHSSGWEVVEAVRG
jgi:quinol monooxygenase YgiN